MKYAKERRISILKTLIQGNCISFEEYNKEFNLSLKTFTRDYYDFLYSGFVMDEETFSKSKILKLKVKETFESYMIPKEYRYEALIGLKSYQTLTGDSLAFIQNLEKSWFNDNVEHWLEIDYSRWITKQYSKSNLEVIKNQILKGENLKFKYALSKYITYFDNEYPDILRDVVIKPIQLIYKDNDFYIKGRSNDGTISLFKLMRIIDLKESCGEPLKGTGDIDIIDYKNFRPENKNEDSIILEFKVPLSCLWLVMDYYPPSDFRIYEKEKYVQVKIKRPKNMYVSHLFQFDDYIYDIKPKEARELFLQKLEHTIKKNRT